MESAQVAEFWEANAETWTRHVRAGYDIYRDTLNTPAFLHMLPPIRGLSGLDIGFGEGSTARRLSAVLHPPPLFRPALPPRSARCGRQGKSHRSSRLFRHSKRASGHLVVFHPARRRSPARRAIPHAALPSHTERIGGDHLPGRADHREIRRTLRQPRAGRQGACRGRYQGSSALSPHSGQKTGSRTIHLNPSDLKGRGRQVRALPPAERTPSDEGYIL